MSSSTKVVAFLGASTGVGLATLKHTLAAGHQCIALCRTPSKLTDIFSPQSTPNLRIVQGNAHNLAVVSQCIQKQDGSLVDEIVSTIGSKPVFTKLTIEDPEVCRKGMSVLLEAINQLRHGGAAGHPHIVVCSTTGISPHGRDIPIAMIPLYHWMLKVPHEDKKIMEDSLVASGESYTIVRPSLLLDGESSKEIRIGIEDPKTGRLSEAIGYSISREDVGKWVAENLVQKVDPAYVNKIAMITW